MPHIHKPKPFGSLKEFASEIVIIVVGVLIALSAEQGVEALHWGHKIDEAENALRLELSEDDGPQAYARDVVETCLQQSLERMRSVLAAKGGRREFLMLARAYRPPVRTWDNEAWAATVASDVGTHMGAERIVRWSTPFRIIPSLTYMSNRELADMDELRGLPDEAGALTEAQIEHLSLALEKVKTDNVMMGQASTLLLITAKAAGADVPEAKKRKILADARADFGACASPPDYKPLSGGVGQYQTPEQQSHLMQYRAAPGAPMPGAW
ncbi:MAG TPA: hypothetical protein VGL66_06025 [Caulobacteraceae bacterium]|jgi:hypothetical protein